MRIYTVTGLQGRLIEYRANPYRPDDGEAIVQRFDAPFSDRPFSVHSLYTNADGELCAENGRYDLTLEDARAMMVPPLTSG